MGVHPNLPCRRAYLLKKQKGKCTHCGLSFQEWDVLEVDHVIPRALSGKDEYKNLQLLHRHCHDEKTHADLIEIRKKDSSKFRDKLHKWWSQFNWGWWNDIPELWGLLDKKSSSDKEVHTE